MSNYSMKETVVQVWLWALVTVYDDSMCSPHVCMCVSDSSGFFRFRPSLWWIECVSGHVKVGVTLSWTCLPSCLLSNLLRMDSSFPQAHWREDNSLFYILFNTRHTAVQVWMQVESRQILYIDKYQPNRQGKAQTERQAWDKMLANRI